MIGQETLDIGGQWLVAGAGKGVGRGIALELAKHNAGGIAVNDFDPGRANEVVEEIPRDGGQGHARRLRCDRPGRGGFGLRRGRRRAWRADHPRQ